MDSRINQADFGARGRSAPKPAYDMKKQLAVEDAHKALVDLLFLSHKIKDISGSEAERKSGTDFLLFPANNDGTYGTAIRCENKFEQYASGRQTLEITSTDRGQLKPGWLFTSQAAWLLSWFPSAELIALPMDEARAIALANPARHMTTTTKNRTYLTWSALEDVNYVMQHAEHARIIDLRYELGREPLLPRMLDGKFLDKHCTADQLAELMRELPPTSEKVSVTPRHLKDLMRQMAPKNLMKASHAEMLKALPWL